ncbi:DUF2867 domain-containing protein [Hymenobacter sp. BT175]|uniref:DUF2867 domain-containing protein n=1 Tax=Hymenobacter translucens TaxID=2886507 RepID=UPI001D0E1565|nr:DUF2867 domain-containing protein [Hymenobacter translucens]MCC2546755.1 DUF2867 domain-containing protein [Hymenobacter translucens]
MSQLPVVTASPLPVNSALRLAHPRAGYVDAYRVKCSGVDSAEAAGRQLFGSSPAWVGALMRLRDTLVRPFGLRTYPADKAVLPSAALLPNAIVGPFRVYSVSQQEVVLGQNDRHLDFRVSVLVEGTEVVVSTAVWFHNWFGTLYFALVRLFHHLVVPALLRHSFRTSSPSA